jgi:hypothetical protein
LIWSWLKSVEVPKSTRTIDLERMRGKQSATSGEITPGQRGGNKQEIWKVGDPDFILTICLQGTGVSKSSTLGEITPEKREGNKQRTPEGQRVRVHLNHLFVRDRFQ